jgi:CHAT domain-containing protein
VSDESTALLMGRFYDGLRQGQTKDAALRRAQVEMLRGARSHPALWAAFQLSGDWK